MSVEPSLPPYTYVPGGPWPHPTRSPQGHSYGRQHGPVHSIMMDQWQNSSAYTEGIILFNAGYYWEAHECWERLWHAHGRKGPIAELLQGLIKLAAAGVKARERRTAGVSKHASGAARLFQQSRNQAGRFQLGLDLDECARYAQEVATAPPKDESTHDQQVTCVFPFKLIPRMLSHTDMAETKDCATLPQ